jgi:hypothetical protein
MNMLENIHVFKHGEGNPLFVLDSCVRSSVFLILYYFIQNVVTSIYLHSFQILLHSSSSSESICHPSRCPS